MFKSIIAISALVFSGLVAAAPVNINTADADTLDSSLIGVGPVTAQRIVEFRQANGDFQSAQDLIKVKGVGQKTFEKNASDILVN